MKVGDLLLQLCSTSLLHCWWRLMCLYQPEIYIILATGLLFYSFAYITASSSFLRSDNQEIFYSTLRGNQIEPLQFWKHRLQTVCEDEWVRRRGMTHQPTGKKNNNKPTHEAAAEKREGDTVVECEACNVHVSPIEGVLYTQHG